MLRRVVDRALDVGVRQPARCLDPDRALGVGRLVLGGDVEDAVGVDVERDLDLGHAAGRRRNPHEVELPEGPIVAGHRPLALHDVHLDAGLPVGRCRERLALLRRNRRVPRDQGRHHPAERLDAQR